MAIILIADDDASIRELLHHALNYSGHHVLQAETGIETLELLRKATVHVLILDMMMPGMDGFTVQAEMAKDSKMKDIPVVVISAYQMTHRDLQSFPNFRKFFPKPFDPMEVVRFVAALTAGNKKA